MNNNEPNKIVSRLYKKFIALRAKETPTYFEEIEKLKVELTNITTVVGAIEVMSKANILKLCAMQSAIRFMALHSFLIYMAKGIEE